MFAVFASYEAGQSRNYKFAVEKIRFLLTIRNGGSTIF